jgi:splicing factor 3B subunit 4
VDEKTLYDTFNQFGGLTVAPKIARDDAGLSKGYGFVSYSNFEASDDAIANMNGQFLMNKEISVQYAYKKDGKGERHGDQAERLLAAQAMKNNVQPSMAQLPSQLFNGPSPNGAPTMMPDQQMNGAGPSPVNGYGGPPGGNYQNVPPPQQAPSIHPSRQQSIPGQHQLQAPPAGLPQRPPPSQAGYGGPQGFPPPGFSQGGPPPGAPPAFGAPGGPPQGFGPPPGQGRGMPPGFGPPPGGLPQGFGGPPGQYLPPGFQQQGYGQGR